MLHIALQDREVMGRMKGLFMRRKMPNVLRKESAWATKHNNLKIMNDEKMKI